MVVPDHRFTREELQAAQPRYSLTSSVPRLGQVDVFLGRDLIACVLNLLKKEAAEEDSRLLILDLLRQKPEISFAAGECGIEIGDALFCVLVAGLLRSVGPAQTICRGSVARWAQDSCEPCSGRRAGVDPGGLRRGGGAAGGSAVGARRAHGDTLASIGERTQNRVVDRHSRFSTRTRVSSRSGLRAGCTIRTRVLCGSGCGTTMRRWGAGRRWIRSCSPGATRTSTATSSTIRPTGSIP